MNVDRMGTAKRLWALDSPMFTMPAGAVMYGMEGVLTLPAPAFLIEHAKGLVLFDTGIDPAAIDDPHGTYGELADIFQFMATADQKIDRQLRALGYNLSDVTHVVASHLHFDHVGALSLFPDAQIYIGQGELPFAFWPAPMMAAGFRRKDFEDIPRHQWREIPGCDVDIFGDTSLVILSTPGHTPGSLSLLVRLPSRNFVLTGDTVHLRAALESEVHYPGDADSAESVRSLRRLKLIRDSADATVWISHDPQDWLEFGHAPTCFE